MASFRGHLAFSACLGAVYGGMAYWQLGVDWGTAALAAGLTAVGGMMPDLDSDSGVPVRELFNLAAVFVPLLFLRRLLSLGLNLEEIFVVLGGLYVLIRFGASRVFKRITVHRGMFHSIPAMLIAGAITFLAYHHPEIRTRFFLALAIMIGFLSHLVLDEMYAVDFRGLKPQLNQFAGSAVKFVSPSRRATALTYAILVVLGALVYVDCRGLPGAQNSARPAPVANIPATK
ncbi:MAG TPA: metal-dependent hydrolase [Gemmataceae bacterium]|jgi:hypothetical protein|nr:metal-dependent hydrolase [Gemmataceae bacterium]